MKLKIFISSVQKEFAYERKLLKRYISKNPAYRRLFDTFVFEEDVVAAAGRTASMMLYAMKVPLLRLAMISRVRWSWRPL